MLPISILLGSPAALALDGAAPPASGLSDGASAPTSPDALPGTLPAPPGGTAAPVVGGGPVAEGDWEDAVALYALGQMTCSGVLVAPDLVLTAGHCRAGLEYAVIGSRDLREGGGEAIPIARVETHPDPYTTYDVALVVLEHEASVAPRRLALDCQVDGYLRSGAEVAIVGFGATDDWGREWSGELRQALTTVLDPRCESIESGCNEQVSPGGELTAGGDGVDTCMGDSGGPLYLRTPEGDLLAGITSRAIVPADAPCGGGGIYVRADAVVDWIEAISGRALPRPDCEGFNHPPDPFAEPIEVRQGATAISVIDPGDADPDQHHTFTLVQPPRRGLAQLDEDGALLYLAPDLPDGRDLAIVEVGDDGAPPRSTLVEIPIHVLPGRERPRGCDTLPRPPGAAFAFAVGLLALRRRSR